MQNNIYKRNPDESPAEYLNRCYETKDELEDLTWKEFADAINDELNICCNESTYRKHYKNSDSVNWIYRYVDNDICKDEPVNEKIDDLKEYINELKKERVKLADERTQNNAYIRRLAREETIKEIANNFAEKISAKKILKTNNVRIVYDNSKEAILMLSDWHYGLDIDLPYNKYNKEVFIDRVVELKEKVIEQLKKDKPAVLHVVCLSDLIAGRIHLPIRLQSREDVISQIMFVSETLAELLTEFSNYTCVVYRDVLDNHSRLEPNKTDSLDLETLQRITPWYLKERLKDNGNIIIDENNISKDIISFEVFNHHIAAVHGDKDKPNKVVNNLNNMLGMKNDMILTAHLHHLIVEEENNCIRISNGSLMGVDTYSAQLRLINKPSQNYIVVTKDDPCNELHRIIL